jgi:hypothetical protein
MDRSKIITIDTCPFQIIDNTLFSRDNTQIYSRNFKIVGTYPYYINVSVIYENNKPADARMYILLGESLNTAISRIKTILNYVYSQLPTLTQIKFDDKTYMLCAACKPISLCHFSMAFNCQTWYEKYFNAKLNDDVKYQQYRTEVSEFLYSTEFKTKMPFDRFVSLIDKREEEMTEIYGYYSDANTFNDFFQSIPKQQRCRLVGSWIERFMKIILNNAFSNEDWVIPFPLEMNGGITTTGNKNKKTRKYYCPKGIITNNFPSKNICISPDEL